MNYGNRNSSSTYTNKDLAIGYSAAILSSVGLALFLRKATSKVTKTLTGSRLILMNSFVNLVANAAANFLNTYCMRRSEM